CLLSSLPPPPPYPLPLHDALPISDCRIVLLTVSDAEDDVVAALRAGADGYLLKDMEPEELLVRIRQAAEGRMVVSEQLAATLARSEEHTSELQSRENLVCRLLLEK